MQPEEQNFGLIEEDEMLRQSAQIENDYNRKREEGQIEGDLNPEQGEEVEPTEEPKDTFSNWTHKIPVVGQAKWAMDSAALGVGDFAADAVGLIPWLKPVDEWWDKNSPRSNHPAHKLIRDASSIIIPSVAGGMGIVRGATVATKAMTIPSAIKTLGVVGAYTGADTAVAAISSHSKKDDNLAGTLNKWLGWDIPWATRAGDSPDVRWKKNVYEAAGMAGGVELLGVAFAFARKTKMIPRDEVAEVAVRQREAKYAGYDNPISAEVESGRAAREAAQMDEMRRAIDADPQGTVYNAFVNDIGPDDAGKAVINTDPDPLLAKVNHTQIQNDLDTLHGRAAPVVDEAFNREFLHAIDGNDRFRKLDQLFDRISPNIDAVVNGKTIKAEQMNRSVDNLTNAVFGQDLPLKEFEFIVDDMKSSIFNSNEFLDEENWIIASRAFENAYNKLFDPNQMRASAMLTQQAADNISDAATAVKTLGEQADSTRQMNIIWDKMNLLGQEVQVNRYIVNKAKEYQKLKVAGNVDDVITWMNRQGGDFDEYVRHVKAEGGKINEMLKKVSKENPAYYKAFIEAFDASNGKIDSIDKLRRVAESNIGLIKKGFIDGEPELPSMLIKQIHAARINGLLSGLAPVRAAAGNSMLTALKPVSVFAGAYLQGQPGAFKRAMYTYGGIIENFKRGLKVMANEWDLARMHPEEAMMRGRVDLKQAQMDQLEYMESMADGWRKAKEPGWQAKVALWNMTKNVSWWNKQQFVRWGTNALYAIDGMTNSFMASGMARARAYDEVLKAHEGAVNFDELFVKKQRELYSEMFDETGKLTDEAAKYASQEIALNLDNTTVKHFENFLESVPVAKGIFMFPRTGINAAQLSWTFNPLSSLGVAIPKMKRVMKAVTQSEQLNALAEHSIRPQSGQDMAAAFAALKSEYIGRQIMGSTVVMGTAVWALNGNLTGSGPQDGAQRAALMRMGWRPFSIKNPITGEWRSYQGFEPFSQVMGLAADMVYHGTRVDQAVTEDWFRKLSFAISMNITNNTFIGGFEPLAGMLTGDATGWNRFWAQQTDQVIPMKGVRTILNNAISPQLRDVNNDFMAYLANGSKFMFGGSERDALPNLLDVYTGKPINYHEPITAYANAILPFFKQNGDMEPWRQWLLSTGWSGLQKIRKNKYTKEPLSPRDRHFINNWIAKNANLQGQITELMTQNDGFFAKKAKEWHKVKGKMPIKQSLVHRELDRIHDRAFEGAWNALEAYNAQFTTQGRLLKMRDYDLRRGMDSEALETQKQILKLQKMRK